MSKTVEENDTATSKKYMAAMRFNWTWSAIVGATLVSMGIADAYEMQTFSAGLSTALVSEVVCLGFVQVLYLGGQAAVDTFVRMAATFAEMGVTIFTRKNGTPTDDGVPLVVPES